MSVGGVNSTNGASGVSSAESCGRSIQYKFAMLQLQQSNICKTQAEYYMNKIEDAQKEQKECADMIAKARELQNTAKDTGKCTEMPKEMVDYFNNHNLKFDTDGSDNWHSGDQWDYNLKSLTNYQETLGSYTQTDMVYLQDFMSQYNSFMQGANSAIQDSNDTLMAILRG